MDKDIMRMVQYVLAKSKNYNTNLVTYSDVMKQVNVPMEKVRIAAIQICKSLMTIPIVEDVDIRDNIEFDIMLKKTART